MLDLVTALEEKGSVNPGEIDNIQVRGGPRPALRPPIQPLDAVPFLARDLLDEPNGVVHLSTQRGCPYPCTYCAARAFDELYGGNAVYGRRRSPENVLAELAGLDAAGTLAYVIFLDDTFILRRRWVEEFCRLYGARFGKPFSLHARVETVDERLLECLAEAGCDQITYGVESGSYRRDVMRRPVTDERIKRAFEWTKAAGIRVTANYMLGVPGESRADLERTLALAEELEAFDFGFFVFYPYPGTTLFESCRTEGYLPEGYLDLPVEHKESILRLPGLGRGEIAEFYERLVGVRERRYLERHAGERAGDAILVRALRRTAATG